ncbi:MAG: hypothetical protein F4X08_04540 [Gemmatimonadetes bacterium]|nr:hypothetical protein [Gemmatimonadota bacterium]MYD25065.1 hypothetical protein [Gemmatimonadota bacterium]MYI98808.1 hypothetical protein [Gemmatimonadota bacterium]
MAKIEWVRRVYEDGWHNAFTDFQFFKGRYYICFRNGLSHVSPDGKAVVISSNDLVDWRRTGVPVNTTGDDRDPHMVATEDRLFVYAGNVTRPDPVQHGDEGPRLIRSVCSFSEDGETWTEPRQVYRDGYWLWGIGRGNNRFYGLAYGNEPAEWDRKPTELHLLQSADGLEWERVSVVTRNGSEATFRITDADTMRIAIRGGDDNRFTLASSEPPYTDWRLQDMGYVIPAPLLVVAGGREYVIGRQHVREPSGPGKPSQQGGADGPGDADDLGPIVERRTSIWRVEEDGVVHVLDLPSGGDTSYAGAVHHEDGALLLSYYSQHEVETGEQHFLYPSNIYLAKVRL